MSRDFWQALATFAWLSGVFGSWTGNFRETMGLQVAVSACPAWFRFFFFRTPGASSYYVCFLGSDLPVTHLGSARYHHMERSQMPLACLGLLIVCT